MREGKCALTLLTAMLCAVCGASEVLAQVVVEPSGPLCVTEGELTSTYTARVRTRYDFWLTLVVFHGGVVRHESRTFVVNDGPFYDFSQVVEHAAWEMKAGDLLNYRGKATIAQGRHEGKYDQKDWFVTVSPPGTCVHEAVPPRDRRRWAA